MKSKILLSSLAIALSLSAFNQKSNLELSFTAIDNTSYVQLDSIKVMNRTQGGDTILYWPDTVLLLDSHVGIKASNIDDDGFEVFQNYPNPVSDQTTISLYVPEEDRLSMIITDALGRVIVKSEMMLDEGTHSFRFIPGAGNLFYFTAQWRGMNSSIKIIQNNSQSRGGSALKYLGSKASSPQHKAMKSFDGFSFSSGDELLYIGYRNTLQSGILDTPETSESYSFQFASNISCPGVPTVTYEGQTYNTVQIFSQCWLKENLNVGTMIPGVNEMSDNGILEKYCYYNNPDYCITYGGLYQWDEMMQYTTQQGSQGICPPGWHIPRDEEWKVLEGAVDSLFRIGHPIWNSYGYRGYDAGMKLKTTSGWTENGHGTDEFGFSALPGGYRYSNGLFSYKGMHSLWWSSTEGNITSAWNRYLSYKNKIVDRDYGDNKIYGFNIRCLRDE